MRNFILIIMGLALILASCKKNDDTITNCEPNCPLPNGEYCQNNMINVNNQCVCPEGDVEYYNRCFNFNDPIFDSSIFVTPLNINCGCVSDNLIFIDFIITDNEFSIYHLNYSYLNGMGIDGPVTTNEQIFGPASPSNFYGDFWPLKCNDNALMMHGSIIGDTLYYDLFFYNTTDTCKGFKVADARL